MMSPEDWQLIKDTAPVKLYGFKWEDQRAIPLGRWKFDFINFKDEILWEKTNFFKKYCGDALKLSGFLFVNDIDTEHTANSEEFFDVPKKIIGMKAIKDIPAGEEIIKEYNYDWHEEFAAWRQGILEGLNLVKKKMTPAEEWANNEIDSWNSQRGDEDHKEYQYFYNFNNALIAIHHRNTNAIWVDGSVVQKLGMNFGYSHQDAFGILKRVIDWQLGDVRLLLNIDTFRRYVTDQGGQALYEGLNLVKKYFQPEEPVRFSDAAPDNLKGNNHLPWTFFRYIDDKSAVIHYKGGSTSGSIPVPLEYIEKINQ